MARSNRNPSSAATHAAQEPRDTSNEGSIATRRAKRLASSSAASTPALTPDAEVNGADGRHKQTRIAATQSTTTSNNSKNNNKTRKKYSTNTAPPPDDPNTGLGMKPANTDTHTSSEEEQQVQQEMRDNKMGVIEAIEDLEKMDRRLQRLTKRQISAIEDSTMPVVPDTTGKKRAFRPRPKSTATTDTVGGGKVGRVIIPDVVPVFRPEGVDEAFPFNPSGTKEATEAIAADQQAAERGAKRPPPVNSSYLPLPWKGRLGYACLNTYLRNAKPPVFSSRTCRIASIIEHRHPLADPSQPEHATKNRPDKTQPADLQRGMRYVQDLGLANARDIVKMIRWNEKYGIKLMRLSSEMFPFASHDEYGYTLAPFASEVLAEAGKLAGELGHRLTTHPGQFTQLGSPRKEVITASVRDLAYHDELLTLLRLPPQADRDAVMILHMGGVYGDKTATLARFRHNYKTLLSPSIKRRLVLENDDVSWSVHDLLPVCEELDIPLVLDWHHHNIIFDEAAVREGTLDISAPEIQERIAATWRRKGITQKMHYSEPCPGQVTPRDRRKHSPRVATLPPCAPDMDLMIEAKDKEQAVFELMRVFKLPGYDLFNDMIPHERDDEVKSERKAKEAAKESTPKKKGGGAGRKKKKHAVVEDEEAEDSDVAMTNGTDTVESQAPEGGLRPEDIGTGGPMGRVYWPPGMEEWLKPKKREPIANKKSKVIKEEENEESC